MKCWLATNDAEGRRGSYKFISSQACNLLWACTGQEVKTQSTTRNKQPGLFQVMDFLFKDILNSLQPLSLCCLITIFSFNIQSDRNPEPQLQMIFFFFTA